MGALTEEKESKVFKSAFAKQLEERRAPLMREMKEEEKAREAAWRFRENERRLVAEESRGAEREVLTRRGNLLAQTTDSVSVCSS